jgi:hypothetical protein
VTTHEPLWRAKLTAFSLSVGWEKTQSTNEPYVVGWVTTLRGVPVRSNTSHAVQPALGLSGSEFALR